jgi:chromosome segregation ATPase
MERNNGRPSNGNLVASVEEKRAKIKSNYETIEVLRSRLEESQNRERAGMTRAAYIKMIFDATRKVDKQNTELARAVLETRQLQRDIRSLSGQLERSFKQVEEAFLRVCIWCLILAGRPLFCIQYRSLITIPRLLIIFLNLEHPPEC